MTSIARRSCSRVTIRWEWAEEMEASNEVDGASSSFVRLGSGGRRKLVCWYSRRRSSCGLQELQSLAELTA
jgi:hypothetical protein